MGTPFLKRSCLARPFSSSVAGFWALAWASSARPSGHFGLGDCGLWARPVCRGWLAASWPSPTDAGGTAPVPVVTTRNVPRSGQMSPCLRTPGLMGQELGRCFGRGLPARASGSRRSLGHLPGDRRLHAAPFSCGARPSLLSLACSARAWPSEGLNLIFLHLNLIIITLVIDNSPPFQRALKSMSAKDDIIVVQGRCAPTVTRSCRNGGLRRSTCCLREVAEPRPPHPRNLRQKDTREGQRLCPRCHSARKDG